ncbi:sugar MFS transporter, partial [Escherichia coli]|nr:sugar MFS transporter [Escherichia coli]
TRFPALDRATAIPGGGRSMFAVLRHRGLLAAIAALFLYVGAQVGVWSFFIDFAKTQAPQLSERAAAFLHSGSLAML